MIGRRAVIGLSLLCALAFSAIAASGAMAETKTTTAFTCVPAETGPGYSKEHCKESDKVSSGAKFKAAPIAASGTWTAFDANNEKVLNETKDPSSAVLSGTVGGLKATFTAKKVTVTGELRNFEDPEKGNAMDIQQRKVTLHFEEVVLSGALKTIEGCEVVEGKVTTELLEATTLVNTMEVEYKPEAPATKFAVIKLAKCKTPELNETGVVVTGSAKGTIDGATVETTVASTAGLKAAGQTASFTSIVTPRMTSGTTTENPISAETIIDP